MSEKMISLKDLEKKLGLDARAVRWMVDCFKKEYPKEVILKEGARQKQLLTERQVKMILELRKERAAKKLPTKTASTHLKIIAYLKKHPEGVTSAQITKAVKITQDALWRLLSGSLLSLPIAYDGRIDNKYYWVGN